MMTRNLTGRQAGRQAGFQISCVANFLQCDSVALLSGLSQASWEALRTLITTVYVKTNVSMFAKFPKAASKM